MFDNNVMTVGDLIERLKGLNPSMRLESPVYGMADEVRITINKDKDGSDICLLEIW